MKESAGIGYQQVFQSYRQFIIGKLMPNIIHEINSPMTSLNINVDTLSSIFNSDKNPDGETKSEWENTLKLSNGEISEMVYDIKQSISRMYASIEIVRAVLSQSAEIITKNSGINNTIDKCLSLLHFKMKYNFNVEKCYNPKLNRINTNVYQLTDILLSLILNSVEAITVNQNGSLIISTTNLNDDSVDIKISDNCGGISNDKLSVFNSANYNPSMLANKNNKPGLGIYFAKKSAEQLNGSIVFSLNGIGGTDCLIRLKSMDI